MNDTRTSGNQGKPLPLKAKIALATQLGVAGLVTIVRNGIVLGLIFRKKISKNSFQPVPDLVSRCRLFSETCYRPSPCGHLLKQQRLPYLQSTHGCIVCETTSFMKHYHVHFDFLKNGNLDKCFVFNSETVQTGNWLCKFITHD